MNDPHMSPARAQRRKRSERAATASGPAYITRRLAPLDALDEESLQRIEATADRILAEVGIELRDDEEAVALFRRAGAQVEGTRLRFEPGMLRTILRTAPSEFTQHARNPARSVRIGGKNVVFAPSYGSPFVMDLDKGRRYGSIEDFRNFVRLAYASPWLHHSGGTVCEPVDLPVNKRHLDMVDAHIRFSDKAFLGSVTAPERAQDCIDMARIVFGADFVDGNCVIMGNVNVNSPLVWDGSATKVIRTYARANQGSVIVPFIQGGAMAPVTSAGAIAQALAETMVGCALTQVERPGAPVVFGNFLASMSLRSGAPTFGTPEPAVGSLVIGQLARRLRLPLRCAGSFSNSKLPDAQAMRESVMSMLSAIHCGTNFVLHSAGFLDGLLSMSYEKFMMDADFCGAMHSYLAGITVDDNTLAFDAISEVGPGHHFLGSEHTLRNCENAYFDSTINDNEPFQTWVETGSKDCATRANERWKAVLAQYEAPALDAAVSDALSDFVARKKDSMPDMWY
ncbi:trimethylamine methyltransferase [Aromatoleum toluvorans]|uniref:Methyltransferase n=1 Tax=Aromatoleum toluvorans TaxID=92002 RepID=A0ABX1Q5E0_9RHOO|nr:trimethylamine methyltransferase family protein [Aromatoleum toluvorans]NMG46117.1 trimethylamine methyltransferase [Aromatoleum toluvorans]